MKENRRLCSVKILHSAITRGEYEKDPRDGTRGSVHMCVCVCMCTYVRVYVEIPGSVSRAVPRRRRQSVVLFGRVRANINLHRRSFIRE